MGPQFLVRKNSTISRSRSFLGSAWQKGPQCNIDYLSSEGIPHYMSQDFMTVEERAKDGQSGKVIWIRTWYGQKNDPASQTAANAGYDRLRSILEYNDLFDCLDEDTFFENEDEFGQEVTNAEFVNGIACATPGSVTSYMIRALMH